ncbi:phosphonoacetaldehyde hydrolase [Metabacillus iocasae]|uniref:Phosphonoacetaldehyde hydrolase n=1 Tax=Priestia iocasae TaxID=2291674 RepID=A0ABS2QY06_9BACI|nr:phosphonoacetaldehyde hydrolase [Metabacillus iocasae]MBM7704355.1 phosphonoacetaldehyde hydrolase [Metabacillus iocasae]
MRNIQGVIFDWAGTMVDFGCFAPVQVFIDIFTEAGVVPTMEEARAPMGMLKIDHIRAMLQGERLGAKWQEVHGRSFTEEDVKQLYAEFESALLASLANYTTPIQGVVATIEVLRKNGLKIGSTTGYTDNMMDIVVPHAKEKGYSPDFMVTADATNGYGRPYPYMIYRNMEKLSIASCAQAVKVGDTISDIKEGLHAGVWTVGVVVGSSEMGLTEEEYYALSDEKKREVKELVTNRFLEAGAHYVIETINELPQLIDTINEVMEQGETPYARL